MTKEELANIFTYHAPFGTQPDRYVSIRKMAMVLGESVLNNTPPSREQSLAITSLQQAVMWANAAISINEKETK